MELMVRNLQLAIESQKQIQVHETAEMKELFQQLTSDVEHKVEEEQVQQFASDLVHNHEQLRTIKEEISSVANNTAAVVNNSKNCFSSSLTSPKQSKFSSAPKDSHSSNVSNGTMLFNPVLATWQAHGMQQDILPEGTTAQFLSVGNALGYGGQVFPDFKAFAIHLPFDRCRTWIHSFLATPKYLMVPVACKLLELNLHSL